MCKTHNHVSFSSYSSQRYFFRNNFDMTYWTYIFPLTAFTIATLLYYSYRDTDYTEFMAKASLAVSSYLWATVFARTVSGQLGVGVAELICAALTHSLVAAALTRRGIFNPPFENGPRMNPLIVHNAFRGSLRKMSKVCFSYLSF
jgi:hypothetical protein